MADRSARPLVVRPTADLSGLQSSRRSNAAQVDPVCAVLLLAILRQPPEVGSGIQLPCSVPGLMVEGLRLKTSADSFGCDCSAHRSGIAGKLLCLSRAPPRLSTPCHARSPSRSRIELHYEFPRYEDLTIEYSSVKIKNRASAAPFEGVSNEVGSPSNGHRLDHRAFLPKIRVNAGISPAGLKCRQHFEALPAPAGGTCWPKRDRRCSYAVTGEAWNFQRPGPGGCVTLLNEVHDRWYPGLPGSFLKDTELDIRLPLYPKRNCWSASGRTGEFDVWPPEVLMGQLHVRHQPRCH